MQPSIKDLRLKWISVDRAIAMRSSLYLQAQTARTATTDTRNLVAEVTLVVTNRNTINHNVFDTGIYEAIKGIKDQGRKAYG